MHKEGNMWQQILPPKLVSALNNVNIKTITELRLRVNKPVVIFTTIKFYLSKNGLTTNEKDALVLGTQEIADIVFNACKHSVYAHNEELKQGFLTLDNGFRLGLSGEIVLDNGNIKTLKNFSSINLRFSKEVKNFSLNSLMYLCNLDNKIYSTLVIAPPNCGKTTYIRDLCYQISSKNIEDNILVVDERNEISASVNSNPTMQLGNNTDVYVGCSKQFGIINGIRTMSPNVIVLDEIATIDDINALNYAINSGVKIIATTHSYNFYTLQKKPLFKNLLSLGAFERFVVLNKEDNVCKVSAIYNENSVCIYSG